MTTTPRDRFASKFEDITARRPYTRPVDMDRTQTGDNGHRFPCANYIRPVADRPCTNPNGCTEDAAFETSAVAAEPEPEDLDAHWARCQSTYFSN